MLYSQVYVTALLEYFNLLQYYILYTWYSSRDTFCEILIVKMSKFQYTTGSVIKNAKVMESERLGKLHTSKILHTVAPQLSKLIGP